MPTLIAPHFILFTESEHCPDLEFHLNQCGEMYIEEHGVSGGFFFTIKKEDWQELKKYIDGQFQAKK